MKFTIDDRPAVFATKPLTVQKMEAAARALPDGKLVSPPQLASRAGLSLGTVKTMGHYVRPDLAVFRSSKKFYGNEKTIKAFKAAYQIRD